MFFFSIVSHNQSNLSYDLVISLLSSQSVVVHYIENDPMSTLIDIDDSNLIKFQNKKPKGFVENHNFAYRRLNLKNNDIFVICNPDISYVVTEFKKFLLLEKKLSNEVATIRIVDNNGDAEDNIREKLNITNFFKRLLFRKSSKYLSNNYWFAGMFVFCRSDVFNKLNGFDESFFLYCEDADFCYRARSLSIKLNVYKEISFIHNARRDSKRKPKYFYLHVKSLIKLWYKHGLFH